MLSKIAFFVLCLHAQADNILAGSRKLEAPEDPSLENVGGCTTLPDIHADCKDLAEDACRAKDDECEWIPTCPLSGERTTNLFEQPQGKHFCHLIDDQSACEKSYRRPPKGRQAKLCYWDSTKKKGKCKGGAQVECENLPRAVATTGRAIKCYHDEFLKANHYYQFVDVTEPFGSEADKGAFKSQGTAGCLNVMMQKFQPNDQMKKVIDNYRKRGDEPVFGFVSQMGKNYNKAKCWAFVHAGRVEQGDDTKPYSHTYQSLHTCSFNSLLGLGGD